MSTAISAQSGASIKQPNWWLRHTSSWNRPVVTVQDRELLRRSTLALMDQRCLSYHASDEQWEGLLLQFITFLRARHPGHNPLSLKVGTLFDELSLPINLRHPQKTMDRFHQAWNRLTADKQIVWVKFHYEAREFPAHKWLSDWFNCSLTVYLPSCKG